MITKCTCVGLKRGKSKENKPFINLVFDVTQILKDRDVDVCGSFTSTLFQWGNVNDSIVGAEITCSVDNYGNVKDIEL